jgi:hypothetical protein
VKGEPLQGQPGLMFDTLMIDAGWGRTAQEVRCAVGVSNLVLCRPNVFKGSLRDYVAHIEVTNRREKRAAKAENREPQLLVQPLDACFPRVKREIEQVQANAAKAGVNAVIIPMGPFAMQAVTDHVSLIRYRGSALKLSARVTAEDENTDE